MFVRVIRLSITLLFSAAVLACTNPVELEQQFIKSDNDDNEYRYLVLDNKLRVLLISDPETDKASASLDIFVGSGNDPDLRPGLVHFLEHMLFLGTDKYPESGEYQQFISEHSGSHNAYTAFEHTNYFFDIDKLFLDSALDRFSQFFVAPRFDAEYVDREKHAVDSEYQSGIKTDGRRELDVFRENINPQHPFNNFSVGSLETLADTEDSRVRDDLLKFYREYYSANIMTLVVLGEEPLDQLQAMVEGRFDKIPNRNVVLEDVTEPLFVEGDLPKRVALRPEATVRQMQLVFPLPDYAQYYHSKPLSYVSNVLGHEGKGSLLAKLKSLGLAEGLAAGGGLAYRGGSALSVTISLTEQGIKQQDQVLALFYQMVSLLKAEGVNEQSFAEQGKIAALNFRFREKASPSGYTRGLANDLHYFSPEEVLSGHYQMDEFAPELIVDLLNRISADNMYLTLVDKAVETDSVTQFYQVPYKTTKIDPETIAGLSGADMVALAKSSGLSLPLANEFIADDLQLARSDKGDDGVPDLVVDSAAIDIWFQKDSEFLIPKGIMSINLRSPAAVGTAREAALMELYVRMSADLVNEFAYPASLAGLEFGLSRHARGMVLQIGGYNDKQQLLLSRLLNAVSQADYKSGRFTNIRSELIRQLENSKTARPFSQLLDNTRELLQSYEWSEPELIAALGSIELGDVEKFHSQFWQGARAEVLMFGNYSQQDATALDEMLSAAMSAEPTGKLAQMALVRLKPGQQFLHEVKIDHQDSAIVFYMQGRDDSWHERAMVSLSNQIIKPGYFQQLRTEQQLGYIVTSYLYSMLDVPGLAFGVQSPAADAAHLFAQTETFLGSILDSEALTEEQFLRHRSALLQLLQEEPKNMWEQSDRYWQDIASAHYSFDSREKIIEALGKITLDDWRQYLAAQLDDDERSILLFNVGRWPEAREKLLNREMQVLNLPELVKFQQSQDKYLRP